MPRHHLYQHKRWFNLPRECIANAGQLVAHSIADFNFHKAAQKKRATFCLNVICAFIASKLIYSIRRGGRRDILTFVGWDISVHVQYAKVCKNGFVEEGIGEHLYLDRVPPNGNSFASTRTRSQSLQTTYFDRHNLSVGRKMGAKSHARIYYRHSRRSVCSTNANKTAEHFKWVNKLLQFSKSHYLSQKL